MRSPRRPPPQPRRVPGARERSQGPVSWSRRLEEAREARARVLASRGKDGAKAFDPDPAESVASPTEPLVAVGAGSDGDLAATRARRGPRAVSWRIAGGFLGGTAAGALVVWLLLPATDAALPEGSPGGDVMPPVASSASSEAVRDSSPEVAAAAIRQALEEAIAADPETAAGPGLDVAEQPREGLPGTAVEVDGEETAVTDAGPGDSPADVGESAATANIAEGGDRLTESASDRARSGSDGPPDEPVRVSEVQAGVEAAAPDRSGEGPTPDATVRTAAAEVVTVPSGDEAGPEATESGDLVPQDGEAAETIPADGVVEADGPASDPPSEPLAEVSAILRVHAAPRVTDTELADAVASLTSAGYVVGDTVRVDFRISQTNVRYFHDADGEVASGVAETLSAESRDFTDYRPLPDPGTIEVWLEG